MASWLAWAIGCTIAVAGLVAPGSQTMAQQVQITSLSDVAFGTVPSITTNQVASQTLCVYTSSLFGYTVKATGSGASGAFTLSNLGNANAQLAYTAQWAFTGGQTSGTLLTPGVGLRSSGGLNLLCSLGSLLAGTASLVIILPSANLSAAQSGNYSGTLSLMVSPN
jgi:hypothetical protein